MAVIPEYIILANFWNCLRLNRFEIVSVMLYCNKRSEGRHTLRIFCSALVIMKRRFLSVLTAMLIALTMSANAVYAAYESTVSTFQYDGMTIPSYDGDPYEVVNGNTPSFTSDEKDSAPTSFESYSELDSKGRAGEAYASLNYELMPTYARGSISSVTPSGWIQAQYDIVSGKWLYNRCHLIGFQLTGVDGENAKKAYLKRNLITGTRYLNVGAGDDQGMLEYENMVADYIKRNQQNHVLYRVTPVYKDPADMLASGVLMEGYSIEDRDISFCVFCYNVQPGISIDYETGQSKITAAVDKNTDTPVKVGTPAIKSLSTTTSCYITKKGKKYHISKKCAGKSAKSTTISKAKKNKKTACKKCAVIRKITVKYSKVSGATGYQVAYKKVGSGSWKHAPITSSTTKTITGLSCGSKYAVKVRAYKTVNGKRTYGSYSKIMYKTTMKK